MSLALQHASHTTSIVLSLSVTGTKTTATSPADGITTPLPTPQTGYAYLSDAFMGVPGTHLWAITGQLEVADGKPGFGISATSYYDPSQSPLFEGTTWMKGGFTSTLGFIGTVSGSDVSGSIYFTLSGNSSDDSAGASVSLDVDVSGHHVRDSASADWDGSG